MLKLARDRVRRRISPRAYEGEERTRQALNMRLSEEQRIANSHRAAVQSLSIESGGRYMLSAGADKRINIFDLVPEVDWEAPARIAARRRGQVELPQLASISKAHRFAIGTVTWYPADPGIFVSSAADGDLVVWDADVLSAAETFSFGERTPIYAHAISPCSQHSLIAVASKAQHIHLCDMSSGSRSHLLKGHTDSVLSVAWSPRDEYLLASASRDKRIFLWDVRMPHGYLHALDYNNSDSGRATSMAHNGAVNGLCFTHDGMRLISTGRDSRMRLWSVASGKNCLVNYPGLFNENRQAVSLTMSYACSRPMVLTPSEREIRVYDVASGQFHGGLTGHFGDVRSIAFHPHLARAYSGGADCEILAWNPPARRAISRTEVDVAVARLEEDNWSESEDEDDEQG
eukprot:m.58672 g.58672  ORF g.58672 m.58672 type:complete len:402 (-) comp7162_c0_seq1:232-1437(-)